MSRLILAGDIGGTKTHLALFEEGEVRKWISATKYKSAQYSQLRAIVKQFLAELGNPEVERACFGVAGPVQGQKSKATNLPWTIDAKLLEREVGSQVHLINDLEANAHGIECLEEEELCILSPGIKVEGNRALIAAGTGLGEAGLFFNGSVYHPFACEGGHCSLAPESRLEVQLLCYLREQYDHVSYERVLSGPGFTHLYRFLVDKGIEKECPKVQAALSKGDPSQVITEMGASGEDAACRRALELFVLLYASEAANLCLKMLAVGGLYIGGGIAPKILGEMKRGAFMKRFVQKGRFAPLLSRIPVKVILNENTALIGAAAYARKHC